MFECRLCEYTTDRKINYNRHLATRKHIIISQKQHFECDQCNFITTNKHNYTVHLKTRKHLMNNNNNSNNNSNENIKHICQYCNKTFNHIASLSRHKRSCTSTNMAVVPISDTNDQIVTMLERQQGVINELVTKVEENGAMTNITNNNTTNNNNKFNLNIFLNETCKDAMSIEDFMNNLNIQIEDIEYMGNHGYVEGMTHIIMDRLNALDITERPFHCTDVKRETMHIKRQDTWRKDIDDEQIKHFVTIVSSLNYRKLPDWRVQHPQCLDITHPDFEYHLHLLGRVLDGYQNSNLDKRVIKNLAKHTAINRQTYMKLGKKKN